MPGAPAPAPSAADYVEVGLHAAVDLAALHAANPQRYPHLLASTAPGASAARYDILFAFPGSTLALEADGRLYRDATAIGPGDFLAALDREWLGGETHGAPARLPFTGGWFVFLGYELAAQIEPRALASRRAEAPLPVACITRFPAAVIRDHAAHGVRLVCERAAAGALLPLMRRDVAAAAPLPALPLVVGDAEGEDPAQFLHRVRRVQDYIHAGDVFQVNVSRRWRAAVRRPCAPVELFRRLRAANPAPFAGLMSLPGRGAIVSSSPERLVEVRRGRIRTRPIAGTYPRGGNRAEDRARARELMGHPKERAEHVMLVDLERNDLGRVCRCGTVRVTELMRLESYRHVHHLVSEIEGRLRPGVTPAEILRAVFPGGTITGCPKVRCLQIIDETESAPRGAYTGSMGYLNLDGSLDLNILIRTLVQTPAAIEWRAGAGIVADSEPQRELAETEAKARAMRAVLERDR